MAGAILPEAVAGGLLLFFVPGYFLVRATFPEWRVRGPEAYRRALEIATLAFVLSVALTVLVGYALLGGAPSGFQAAWTDPILESVLAAIALVGFVAGWFRGAYAREPPPAPAVEASAGDVGAWEVGRELDRLAREERRLTHELRVDHDNDRAAARLREELDRVRLRREELVREREGQYAAP